MERNLKALLLHLSKPIQQALVLTHTNTLVFVYLPQRMMEAKTSVL